MRKLEKMAWFEEIIGQEGVKDMYVKANSVLLEKG